MDPIDAQTKLPPGWMTTDEMIRRLGLPWRNWWSLVKDIGVKDRDWMQDPDRPDKDTRPNPVYMFFRPEVEAVLAAVLRKDLTVPQARLALAGETPALVPEPIPVPRDSPEQDEEMTVWSRPRLWPNGQAQHFANPLAIQAKRDNGEIVAVRVSKSVCFTPLGWDGKPMRLRARWQGEPRHWALVGPLPRGIGRW